jgi:hypothetical protein
MYRKTAMIIILILLLAPAGIEASGLTDIIEVYRGGIQIIIDNQQVVLEEEPFIYNGRVYVPLRFIGAELGQQIEWIPSQRAVVVSSPGLDIAIEECRPDLGEIFIYGQVLDIDYNNFLITIEQHYDDNSIPVDNPLSITHDVVIRRDNRNIHFYQLKAGDVGGFIMNTSGKIRGIVMS